jgi:glycolate oxidase FAD binding subunit
VPETLEKEAAISSFELDGQQASAVYSPATETEIVECIARAIANGQAVVPWGGGTSISIGNPLPAKDWIALDSSRYAGIIDYSPEDMVVTVRSGTLMVELQALLEEQKQWLPLDVPHADIATVGGVVACNATGLYRPMYSAPRDRVLAMRVVLADGSVVQCGAKVVKNVAGYDMAKLFCGSYGTLGFISEVTFKTSPLPFSRLTLSFSGESAQQVAKAALDVHLQRLQIAYLLLETSIGQNRLHVGLHGGEAATQWQSETVSKLFLHVGLERVSAPINEEALRTVNVGAGNVRFILSAKPSAIPELNALIEQSGWYGRSSVELGTSTIDVPATDLSTAQQAAKQLAAFGSVRWESLLVEWKEQVDVWGETAGGIALMAGIKKTLDPGSVFSPGRYVRGV